jgi:hypothetical protein
MTPVRSRLLWTDGHNSVLDVDAQSSEMAMTAEDGREHYFTLSRSPDPAGLPVWVEESREWQRFHRNGSRALVCRHADVNPGRYTAGSGFRGDPTGFEVNIESLDEAKRIADNASGCRQPCDCPPWSE